jgi:N-acetylglucosamine-6-phosphate deacetylase
MNIVMNEQLSFKGRIVTDSGIEDGYLTMKNGYIVDMGALRPENCIVDTGNAYILPGFIDLHIHGIHTSLVDNGAEALADICRILPQYGVTGFLPTVAPRPKGEDEIFLTELGRTETEGAEILGFHLEGPFLKITGALNASAIACCDSHRVKSLINAAKPYKAIFSISPDVEGIENLIPLMADNNTPVFMTHTAANVEETQRAIELGARHATHFYDVFPCPEVTEPGVRPCGAVEAILADERVSVDFILDGVHVDPVAVKMAMACKSKGAGCVCLITDANVGAGLEPGRFVFGDSGEIYFPSKGGPARSVENNTLAGSGLTMDQALRNAVKWLGVSIAEASEMLSANPARVLGIDHKKGKLSVGCSADFVVLDEELNVLQTWINGKCFFERK